MAYRTSSRPKRVRYVVAFRHKTTGERVTEHVLAYDADFPRKAVERLGHECLSVRRYVKGENVRIDPDAGFRINTLNQRKAEADLGLTWPVVIVRSNARGGKRGSYLPTVRNGRPAHQITLKNYLSPQQAGETFWHELTHAAQAERVANRVGAIPNQRTFVLAWNSAYKDGVTYSEKPMEREAQRNEARNAETPLARK